MTNFEQAPNIDQPAEDQLKIDTVLKADQTSESDFVSPEGELLTTENIDIIMEQLDNDTIFTKAADKFLETIDDTFIMKGVRGSWDAIPEKGQDAFLAARHAPNPIINMYPWITKLMTDMGVLERKGLNAQEKILQSLENDALVDKYTEIAANAIPGGEVAAPIVEKIAEAKSVLRDWMAKRREKLLAIRRSGEAALADSESMQNLREQIDSKNN
jgi:hypothetical protein